MSITESGSPLDLSGMVEVIDPSLLDQAVISNPSTPEGLEVWKAIYSSLTDNQDFGGPQGALAKAVLLGTLKELHGTSVEDIKSRYRESYEQTKIVHDLLRESGRMFAIVNYRTQVLGIYRSAGDGIQAFVHWPQASVFELPATETAGINFHSNETLSPDESPNATLPYESIEHALFDARIAESTGHKNHGVDVQAALAHMNDHKPEYPLLIIGPDGVEAAATATHEESFLTSLHWDAK